MSSSLPQTNPEMNKSRNSIESSAGILESSKVCRSSPSSKSCKSTKVSNLTEEGRLKPRKLAKKKLSTESSSSRSSKTFDLSKEVGGIKAKERQDKKNKQKYKHSSTYHSERINKRKKSLQSKKDVVELLAEQFKNLSITDIKNVCKHKHVKYELKTAKVVCKELQKVISQQMNTEHNSGEPKSVQKTAREDDKPKNENNDKEIEEKIDENNNQNNTNTIIITQEQNELISELIEWKPTLDIQQSYFILTEHKWDFNAAVRSIFTEEDKETNEKTLGMKKTGGKQICATDVNNVEDTDHTAKTLNCQFCQMRTTNYIQCTSCNRIGCVPCGEFAEIGDSLLCYICLKNNKKSDNLDNKKSKPKLQKSSSCGKTYFTFHIENIGVKCKINKLTNNNNHSNGLDLKGVDPTLIDRIVDANIKYKNTTYTHKRKIDQEMEQMERNNIPTMDPKTLSEYIKAAKNATEDTEDEDTINDYSSSNDLDDACSSS